MSIKAKVMTKDAEKQTINQIDISEASAYGSTTFDISLNLGLNDIQSLSRDGNDLILLLANGEVERIVDFYIDDDDLKNRLFFSESGHIDMVDITNIEDGVNLASTSSNSVSPELIFQTEPELSAVSQGAGVASSDLSGAALAALIGGVGALAALASGGGGGSGSSSSVVTDSIAPEAPTVNPTDGSELTGSAEPGSTVNIDTDGDGEPDATVVADPDTGELSFTPDTPLADGTTVSVTATDESGNESDATSVVTDSTAPEAPTVNASDGTEITGTAEPGATVNIDTDGDGEPDATVVADPDTGEWSFTPDTPVADGTTVSVTAADESGNESEPTSVVTDSTAPEAPTVNPSDGSEVMGTAEPGATVNIDTDGDGTPDATVVADPDTGEWSFTPDTPVADGTTVSVTATDESGNESEPTSVVTDSTAPEAPTVNPSDGSEVMGTAEPGATVNIDTDGDGTPDATVVADPDTGEWSFTPDTPVADDTTVSVTAADESGNESAPTSVVTDSTPPEAPTVNPSDGSEVMGTAEPGATVNIDTDGDGTPDATVVADPDTGEWSFTPDTPVADGTTVSVTATDESGNESEPTSVVTDSTPPEAPTVNPSDGTAITGTAEPGATVNIDTDGDGEPDGTVTADPDTGEWSFTPDTPLADSTTVSATATDAAGNESEPTSVVTDSIPPEAPTVNPSDGTAITGTAEPGATVNIDTDGDGEPDGTAVADPDTGEWSFTPDTPLADSTTVSVTATDESGNESEPTSVVTDSIPPEAPTVNPSDGTAITGTAEPGATVNIDTDGDGEPDGTAVADPDTGEWSFTPDTPLADGTTVSATATDAAGNESEPTSVVTDSIAPEAPTVNPSDGTAITGTAEPGATVNIDTDGDGEPDGTAVADPDTGEWSFTPDTPLADGTTVSVTATDAAGNESEPTSVVTDSIPPEAPIVNPSDGSVITGTAEPGATVNIDTDGDGTPDGTAVADPDTGEWSFTPDTPLADGTTVSATATDESGNESAPTSVVTDSTPPEAPIVNPSDGSVITGTAEPGATVNIDTDGDGTPDATVVSDPDTGEWSFTPDTPLADGTTVSATATDESGNESEPTSVVTDSTPPEAPIVNPSDGSVITGTAEPGATVNIDTDGDGEPDGTAVADPDTGEWSFTPDTPLADGTTVSATATDPAGNESEPTSVVTDSTPPEAPTVNPSDGSVITGTAEPGSTVNIDTDGDGEPDGTAVADPDTGEWSFTPDTPLADGTTVSVTATDESGNESAPTSVVTDSTAPEAPTLDLGDGTEITGTAEPGSTVNIDTDGDGEPDGTAVADPDTGEWSFTPDTPLADGTTVSATATDAVGNESSATTEVFDDVFPPEAPVINAEAEGGVYPIVTGTGEPGATLTLTDETGAVIGTTTVESDGSWSIFSSSRIVDTENLTATQEDTGGNVSPQTTASIRIDSDGDTIFDSIDIDDDGDGILDTEEGLLFEETGDTIYIQDTNNDIYIVRNIGTATETVTGPIDLDDPNIFGDIAVSPEGVLYGIERSGDEIWRLDITIEGDTVTVVETFVVKLEGLTSAPFAFSDGFAFGSDGTGYIVNEDTVFAWDPITNDVTAILSLQSDGDDIVVINGNFYVAVSGALYEGVLPDNFDPKDGPFFLGADTIIGDIPSSNGMAATRDGNIIIANNNFNSSGALRLLVMDYSTSPTTFTEQTLPGDYFNVFLAGLAGRNEAGPSAAPKYDSDGVPDHLDTDSDGDGIGDNIEAQNNNSNFIAPTGLDDDGDGLDNAYDATPTSGAADSLGLIPVDNDADGLSDHVDTDSNGNGTPDRDDVTLNDTFINELISGAVINGTLSDVDVIVLDGGVPLTLDLTQIDNSNIIDFERIDMKGDSANTLTLELQDLLDLSSTSDTLLVLGDADDQVNASGFATDGSKDTIDGEVYDVYTSGAATLLVDQDVTVNV